MAWCDVHQCPSIVCDHTHKPDEPPPPQLTLGGLRQQLRQMECLPDDLWVCVREHHSPEADVIAICRGYTVDGDKLVLH